MTLGATTYSAYRGYSWSSIPAGVTEPELDRLYRLVSAARGDFPDPLSVEVGLVSDGKTVAAFTLQNVEKWDMENRASDYAAFVLFPVERAADIDFITLLNHDIFWTPSRTPPSSLAYEGGPAEKVSPRELVEMLMSRRCQLANPKAIGDLLAKLGSRSRQWVCLMKDENVLNVECGEWSQTHERGEERGK